MVPSFFIGFYCACGASAEAASKARANLCRLCGKSSHDEPAALFSKIINTVDIPGNKTPFRRIGGTGVCVRVFFVTYSVNLYGGLIYGAKIGGRPAVRICHQSRNAINPSTRGY